LWGQSLLAGARINDGKKKAKGWKICIACFLTNLSRGRGVGGEAEVKSNRRWEIARVNKLELPASSWVEAIKGGGGRENL